MTLTRTIHRRNARRRARAGAEARKRIWDALTPEQQARELAMKARINESYSWVIRESADLLRDSLADIYHYSRQQW